MTQATRQPFPWTDVMAFGLGVLKLEPAAFWAMTPRELDAALQGHYGRSRHVEGMPRVALQALLDRFPD